MAPGVFDLPVFEAADVFPLMPEDELRELAEDIAANGLREPIVVDEVEGKRVLIDGKNRRAACKIAGIEDPPTQGLAGADPYAYEASKNVHRRDKSKGARAMAMAKLRLFTKQTVREAGEESGVGPSYISKAQAVLDHAPDLTNLVLSEAVSLESAYGEARGRKERMEALRRTHPDLANKVVEAKLLLRDAEEEARVQDMWDRSEIREEVLDKLRTVAKALKPFEDPYYVAAIRESLRQHRHEIPPVFTRPPGGWGTLLDALDAMYAGFRACVEVLKKP